MEVESFLLRPAGLDPASGTARLRRKKSLLRSRTWSRWTPDRFRG